MKVIKDPKPTTFVTPAQTFYQSSFEQVDVRTLLVPEYQRPLTVIRRRALYRRWDPRYVGVLFVSNRDGQLWVVDGHARSAVAIEKEFYTLPAIVFHNLSYEQEAGIYYATQAVRANLSAIDAIKGAIEARDPEILAIKQMVEHRGLRLAGDKDASTADDKTVLAVRTVQRMYRKSPTLLSKTLEFVTVAWGSNSRDATASEMLSGVSRILALHGDNVKFDGQRLIDKMRSMTAESVRSAAHSRANAVSAKKFASGGASKHLGRAVAEVLMSEYNDRLHVDKKLAV